MKSLWLGMLIIFPAVLPALSSLEAEKQFVLHPDNGKLAADLGESCIREEKWDKALVSYQKAIKLRPEEAAYYVRLVKVCDELRRPDLAFDCLDKVRADFQKNSRFMGALASLEMSLGKFSQALRDYEEALKNCVYRDRPFYLSGLGKSLRELKRFREAERYFITALQQKEDAWIYYELGKLYLAEKRFNEASRALTHSKARLVGPKKQGRDLVCGRLAMALFEYARQLKDQGKKSEAKHVLTKITGDRDLSKTPWNEKAQFWLRRL